MGLEMELGEHDVTSIAGAAQAVRRPGRRRDSLVDQEAEPAPALPRSRPRVRAFRRAWPTAHTHPADVGGQELTPDEYYRLILNIDMGGQYFFRENRTPGGDPLSEKTTWTRPRQ